MRLRFLRSPVAPSDAWPPLALAMRSLRRSSLLFFFGRVDWLIADRSILPTTLMVGIFCGRDRLKISSFGSCLTSAGCAFSETGAAGAAAASTLTTGTSSCSCFTSGAAATETSGSLCEGFSTFFSATSTSAADTLGRAGSTATGSTSTFADSFTAGSGSTATGSGVWTGAGAGLGSTATGFTGLPWRSSSILPRNFGRCISAPRRISSTGRGAGEGFVFSRSRALSVDSCCDLLF